MSPDISLSTLMFKTQDYPHDHCLHNGINQGPHFAKILDQSMQCMLTVNKYISRHHGLFLVRKIYPTGPEKVTSTSPTLVQDTELVWTWFSTN